MKGPAASPLVRKALAFAAERHAEQRRKGDGLPFIIHPRAVGRLLQRAGQAEQVVAAGVLHDVLEDTPTTAQELSRRFGRRVAELVKEVTEPDKSHSWEVRKAAYLAHLRRASRGALAISCADKLHNSVSLLAAYRRDGPEVFDRFSRGVDRKLAYERAAYRAIQRRWSGCPFLGPLGRSLVKLEGVAQRVMANQPKETEAKFLVESLAAWGRMSSLRGIGELRRVGAATERQRNAYWDTADLRLHRAHAALKLRQVGRRAELTFKRELTYRAGVSQRLEITVPARAREIQRLLSDPASNEAARQARKIVGARPLREVLMLRTVRRKILFGQRGGKGRLEMALDQVSVMRGGRVLDRHRELELENAGLPEGIFRQALAAFRRQRGAGLRICRRSKYELGLEALKKSGNL